jgi:hypothetical protein
VKVARILASAEAGAGVVIGFFLGIVAISNLVGSIALPIVFVALACSCLEFLFARDLGLGRDRTIVLTLLFAIATSLSFLGVGAIIGVPLVAFGFLELLLALSTAFLLLIPGRSQPSPRQ